MALAALVRGPLPYLTAEGPPHGAWDFDGLGPARPLPLWGGVLCHFGTTEYPATLLRGPPQLLKHLGACRVRLGASATVGPPRPLPLWCRGLRCFGTTKPLHLWYRGIRGLGTTRPPAALGWGSVPLWDHRGPQYFGTGGSVAMGIPRLPPVWCGGLRPFGTTELASALLLGSSLVWDHQGPTSFAQRPMWIWDHRGPRRVPARVTATFGPWRPLPLWCYGLRGFGTIEAPMVWYRGLHEFGATGRLPRCGGVPADLAPVVWHTGLRKFGIAASPSRISVRASAALGPPRPPPFWCGGVRRFASTDALAI